MTRQTEQEKIDGGPDARRGGQVIIARSPKAGSGAGGLQLAQFCRVLTAEGWQVSEESAVSSIVEQVAKISGGDRPYCVVGAGGDGTLNLLASRLPEKTPLLPFPLGTENLVARHYGLFERGRPIDVNRLAQAITSGVDHDVDAGIAKFPSHEEVGRTPQFVKERLFLIMASVGFDAEVVRRMHLLRRGHIRRWSYFKPIWAMLRSYRYPRIRVFRGDECDASRENGVDPLTVAWALVFNLPRYAAGLAIESAADETDGLLDFCGLTRGSHVHGVRYLAGILSRRHHTWSDVVRWRDQRVRLESDQRLAVQLDGDYAGRLPCEIRVASQRVRLRLPRQWRRGMLS